MKTQAINGLPLPSDFMLTRQFWELYEASFSLTEWPKNMIAGALPIHFHDTLGHGVVYFSNDASNLK